MSELNSEQLAVVNSDAPRILCPASAGSGKSRVGVEWIRRHIADGTDPKRIIAISFSNAASNVLQERLGDIRLGVNSTLHAFILRLLQKHGHLIGLPKNLSVIDDEAREGIVESIISELGVKSSLKKVMPMLDDPVLIEHTRAGMKTKDELVAVEYHVRLRKSGLLDFNGVLYYGLKLIKSIAGSHPDLWAYTHILLDEFQDSAPLDFQILMAMPCKFKLTLGDDKQGIFGFRKACVQNIINLNRDPDWTSLPLTTNYRCKSKIQLAANNLISHNPDRIPIETRAHESGGNVVVESFKTPAEEMAFVANELTRSPNAVTMVPANLEELRQTAVLCRTNALAQAFSTYLEGLGIPVAKKKPVTVPGDWRAARLLLTVMVSPFNDLAVHQFLVATKGKSAADVLRRDAAVNMTSLYQHAMKDGASGDVAAGLAAHGISHESRERIHDACRQLPEGWTVPELIMFLNSGEADAQQIGDGVFCGTAHASKGREFSTCYIVGCEDDMYPGRDNIDEARRLLYVAITRAKQRVVICHCAARPKNRGANMRPGPMEPKQPSRFMAELAGK